MVYFLFLFIREPVVEGVCSKFEDCFEGIEICFFLFDLTCSSFFSKMGNTETSDTKEETKNDPNPYPSQETQDSSKFLTFCCIEAVIFAPL